MDDVEFEEAKKARMLCLIDQREDGRGCGTCFVCKPHAYDPDLLRKLQEWRDRIRKVF